MTAINDDDDPTRGVELSDYIDRAIRAALSERVRSMIPARVAKLHLDGDGNLISVDCKPLVGDFHRDETGALVTRSVPIINNVPVQFMTGGGFTFTVPIVAGASGTLGALFFSDRSMDRWLSGQGQEVTDPEIYTRSALTDAVFFPGLLPFGAPMDPAAPVDHATAGSIAGKRIHFRDGVICAGDEAGSDFGSLAGKVADTLDRLQTVLNVFFKATATPVNEPGNGAPSALQIALMAAFSAAHITDTLGVDHTWPDSTAAEQFKAK